MREIINGIFYVMRAGRRLIPPIQKCSAKLPSRRE
jgi:hypothetical protein